MKYLVLIGIALAALSCGGHSSDYQDAPAPAPAPGPAPDWATVAPIIAADCGPCHNGTKEPALTPSATFKASSALAKLKLGQMPPPPRIISATDKATLIAYLGG